MVRVECEVVSLVFDMQNKLKSCHILFAIQSDRMTPLGIDEPPTFIIPTYV